MPHSPGFSALFTCVLGVALLSASPVEAQPAYPPNPSFDAVVKDARKDGILNTLKGLGVPESALAAVKFEKLGSQDKRNFTSDTRYYKENAIKFNDRLVSYVFAVVPKAALGASFRVPIEVHYTRYVENEGNWTLLNKWQLLRADHGLEAMVSPPDLGMPADPAKLAAIDAFFASGPDLERHRFTTRDILSVQKVGVHTPNAELGVDEAVDLKTFIWRLAARVEVAKERNEEGVTESAFDNVLFKFTVDRSTDGRFKVTSLSDISSCSQADAEAAGVGGEERQEVTHPSPLKVGNLRTAGWAAVQRKRAPFAEEPGSHEHLKRLATQFEAVLKGFRFQSPSEARALDSWAAPEREFKADEAWQQLKDKVAVRAIEEQASGASFNFLGAQVLASSMESAHRPETGDVSRSIPAMGKVEWTLKYKIQCRIDGKVRDLSADVIVEADFVGDGNRFLATGFQVR